MRILTKGKYYGSKKRELTFKGIVLSEYAYEIPRTDWHYHENPYFMYLLQGDVFDVNKNGKTICPQGSLLFHNWDEQHFNEKYSRDAKGFHIEFDRSWFQQHQLNIELWNGSAKLDDPGIHQLLGKLYYEFHTQDECSEIGIETSLLALCEAVDPHVRKGTSSSPDWLPKLRAILNDASGNLSLKEISQQLNVHPVHISRSAPKYLGCGISEYLRRVKLKKALNLLSHSNCSLTEISLLSGFYDQSHFIKVFKNYFGFSPKTYLQQIGTVRKC